MITRIEIDGFKTFQDFKLELTPFQVIVGPNGVGKSNLFDAMRLLSWLADDDLRSAFGELRGEAGELFTMMPDGFPMPCMRLAAEMLVEPTVQDSWGAQATIRFTRLRYELEIHRRADEQGLERLYVTKESLMPIKRSDDGWFKRHSRQAGDRRQQPLKAGRSKPFISTEQEGDVATIYQHQDGHGGRKASRADRIERTMLSGVANTEFPHVFAAREEMRHWRFLHLNPEVLHQPSSMLANPSVLPDGGNLPSALARMQGEDPLLLGDVARDLSNLVPGIISVSVEKDIPGNRYVVGVTTQDGRTFSSRVLSDGTLRLLALATLRNDPEHRGVMCFEEPENGLHPFRLEKMVHLLRGLATDFSDPDQESLPLRQLLVNTHSPLLVSQPDVVKDVLVAYVATRVVPGQSSSMRVTRIVPMSLDPRLEIPLGVDDAEVTYTRDQAIKYLTTMDATDALAALQAAAV